MGHTVNRVTLLGNVGRDPEIRTTTHGTPVARVSLATDRSWVDRNGEEQARTDWHRLTFFGRLAEVAGEWVRKGSRVYVEGRLHHDRTDEDDGSTRWWTEVVVERLILLGGASEPRATEPKGATEHVPTGRGDDLPF